MPFPFSRSSRLAVAGVVAALTGALVLGGCGSSSGSSSSSSGALKRVSVSSSSSSSAGEAPTPTIKVSGGPLRTTSTTRRVLRAGKGTKIADGDAVVVRFEGVNGRTGKSFGSDFGGPPASFVLGSKVIAGFRKALTGVRSGSRVLAAVSPADGYGPSGGVSSLKIKKTDSLVYLIDVLAVTSPRAHGTAQAAGPGLPSVELASDGRPTITIPSGVAAPTTLVSKTLIQGRGATVRSGDYVTVQYSGVNYRTGKVFDASWTQGTPATFQIGTGKVIPGWDKTIVGAKVGSQLLLVIPPADGYGPQGGQSSAGITATDTLVFVVDVLATTK